ncbi:MAG: M1 family metallopeptidase [Ekhidna sp.]
MNFKKSSLFIVLFSCVLISCKYTPFVKYFTQKKDTGFPRFSEKNRFKGEANEFRAYDIITYDWEVKVISDKKRIESVMKIDFVMEQNQSTIMLDLQKKLKVENIVSSIPIEKWKHNGDLLYIYFEKEVKARTSGSLSISYGGKPINLAHQGPIQWKEDKTGKPWISTQTEGIGAHYMMPCKELLYEEPEQCFIRVSVPKDLVAVANGKLDSLTDEGDYHTYHWSVLNPINIYNISFNIGDFVKIQKDYEDINGQQQVIDVFGLRQDEDTISTFYEQTMLHMEKLEELYGVFPWWRDGCKIVQSTLGGSAMEHQSAISMGSILWNNFRPEDTLHINTTLTHELAHEWWGNLVSGNDYCDMWIHEGFATYSEVLVVEKIYGTKYYNSFINWMAKYIDNERSVIKPCGVRYNSWVSDKDGDIYNKGALTLHTVRMQLDDDPLFFDMLKSALAEFQRTNITSAELIEFFSRKAGQDLSPLFNMYLNFAEPPTFEYAYDSIASNLSYKWAYSLNDDFPLNVVVISGDNKIEITPSNSVQNLTVNQKPEFKVSDFGYVLLKDINAKKKK